MSHQRTLLAACLALFVAGFAGARYGPAAMLGRRTEKAAGTAGEGRAVGSELPDAILEDYRGRPLRLSTVTSGRPTLILLASAEDCLSCANFPVEMRILRNRLPGLKRIFLATGSDTEFFRAYGRQRRIESEMVLDPRGEALERLGAVGRTPAVLLLDADGKILLFEHRSGPGFSAYPLTEQLLGVLRVLNAAGAPRVAPGGEGAAQTSVPMPEPGASTTRTGKAP